MLSLQCSLFFHSFSSFSFFFFFFFFHFLCRRPFNIASSRSIPPPSLTLQCRDISGFLHVDNVEYFAQTITSSASEGKREGKVLSKLWMVITDVLRGTSRMRTPKGSRFLDESEMNKLLSNISLIKSYSFDIFDFR